MPVMQAFQPTEGVHFQPGFLDAEALGCVRRAMAIGVREPAEVLGEAIARRRQVRHAANVEIDEGTLVLVERLLDDYRPTVAARFATELRSREGPSFLSYPAGGRYRPHRDRAHVASWPDARRRLVAVVVFLNGSRAVDASGEFDGGLLRLFAEDGAPLVEVEARAGMLVAFRADRLHEVTPVRGGTRETIVDWYYA
jgi:predicted 2-oxoglutarate/Fe(II)-dependent dioxygenase YbiX